MDLNDGNEYIETMLRKFPNILKKITIGTTSEDNELYIVEISTGRKMQSIFIEGGEQGRDWASPAIVMSIIDGILLNNTTIANFLNTYNFYFLPFFNPDGYNYSIHKVNKFIITLFLFCYFPFV